MVDFVVDECGNSYIRVYAKGSDIPYSYDGRYYLRTAAADEQIGSDFLRKILVSGNTDMLTQVTSEEQALTFLGMVDYLKGKGIHASETKEMI